MDYAFAPRLDSQTGRVRMMFARRAQTTTIQRRKGRTTVRQFIHHLDTAAAIAKPIGNMLLGAHASSEGEIFIRLFPGKARDTNWDALERSLSAAANSVAIPDSLIGYTSGPPTAFLHFKGCNAGKQRPFLVKLKEALGDHVNVTAPKHFHDIWFDTRYGVWESMAYEFRIQRPKFFADPADALSELQGAPDMNLINNSPVPSANWPIWIPKRISVRRTTKWTVHANLGSSFGKRKTIPTTLEFRVEPTEFPTFIKSSATTDAARKADLQAELATRARFKSSHPFPRYKELGYSSLANFLNGYTWKFTPSGSDLHCLGSRIIYTSVIPILDPADSLKGNLIFNFYPNSGSSIPAITTTLQENDAKFFESV
jgi:hypothetical protein